MIKHEEKQHQENLDDMHRRRVIMPDGRYQIFYTFGESESDEINEPTKDVQPQEELETSEGDHV